MKKTVETRADGTEVTSWRKNGVLHREDGPAYIEKSDKHYFLKWYRSGAIHRDGDRPALIERRKIDDHRLSMWYTKGLQHRGDGMPTVIETRADGTEVIMWHVRGKLHREDGPAHVERDVDGHDVETWWYIDGEQLDL